MKIWTEVRMQKGFSNGLFLASFTWVTSVNNTELNRGLVYYDFNEDVLDQYLCTNRWDNKRV